MHAWGHSMARVLVLGLALSSVSAELSLRGAALDTAADESSGNATLTSTCSYTASCTVSGVAGVCVSISAGCCNTGTKYSGYCPGSSDIECCIKPTCTTPYGSGTCQATSACSGTSYSGYCAGPSSMECCVGSSPTPSPPSPSPPTPTSTKLGVDVSLRGRGKGRNLTQKREQPCARRVASCAKSQHTRVFLKKCFRTCARCFFYAAACALLRCPQRCLRPRRRASSRAASASSSRAASSPRGRSTPRSAPRSTTPNPRASPRATCELCAFHARAPFGNLLWQSSSFFLFENPCDLLLPPRPQVPLSVPHLQRVRGVSSLDLGVLPGGHLLFSVVRPRLARRGRVTVLDGVYLLQPGDGIGSTSSKGSFLFVFWFSWHPRPHFLFFPFF